MYRCYRAARHDLQGGLGRRAPRHPASALAEAVTLRRLTLGAAAALGLAWLTGFGVFVARLDAPAAATARADGIVVLTGGADRVAEGLRLLKAGRGRALLISGVGKGVQLPALERDAGIDASHVAGLVELGHEATSTTGNADETAGWARRRGFRSLLVVTASYHMMRARAELQSALPGVELVADPVLPPALRQDHFSIATLRLLAHEYTKLLASRLGLGRLSGGFGETGGEAGGETRADGPAHISGKDL